VIAGPSGAVEMLAQIDHGGELMLDFCHEVA
jgi:hypothetical protein